MGKIENTSIANKAMLRFAKEYAKENWYLEGWQKPDDFWGNAYDKQLHPDKPQVVPVCYVAPIFEEDKEELYHWKIPRTEIDSHFGQPRLNVVDREQNFCCLSYDRDTNEFKEAQAWGKDGLKLATSVKNHIDLFIQAIKDGYDIQFG